MWLFNLSRLAMIQLRRHAVRSLLTALGVAAGIFLFVAVGLMHRGLARATTSAAEDAVLVVYRQNRFCPFTSRLPQSYERKIMAIPGVRAVYPIQIIVNSCTTSLDVVTFRGIAPERMAEFGRDFRLRQGSLADWGRRSDAALVGRVLAERRRVAVGDKLDAAGITVTVAGIIDSDNPQDLNVAYVHLDFLQQASRVGLGIVTQFNVQVADSSRLEDVARAIDETFRYDQDPTSTRPEKAFVAQAIGEVAMFIRGARLVGWAALAAVFLLMANTIVLSVRGRVRELAVMQAVGFGRGHLVWLVLVEGMALGVIGGLAGLGAAAATIHFGRFSLSVDALSVVFAVEPGTVATGLVVALGLGLLAGLAPAWQVARQDLVASFRAE